MIKTIYLALAAMAVASCAIHPSKQSDREPTCVVFRPAGDDRASMLMHVAVEIAVRTTPGYSWSDLLENQCQTGLLISMVSNASPRRGGGERDLAAASFQVGLFEAGKHDILYPPMLPDRRIPYLGLQEVEIKFLVDELPNFGETEPGRISRLISRELLRNLTPTPMGELSGAMDPNEPKTVD